MRSKHQRRRICAACGEPIGKPWNDGSAGFCRILSDRRYVHFSPDRCFEAGGEKARRRWTRLVKRLKKEREMREKAKKLVETKTHPVILHLLDEIGDGPMLKLNFKSGINKETRRKIQAAFDEIRPKVEKDILCRAISASGVV